MNIKQKTSSLPRTFRKSGFKWQREPLKDLHYDVLNDQSEELRELFMQKSIEERIQLIQEAVAGTEGFTIILQGLRDPNHEVRVAAVKETHKFPLDKQINILEQQIRFDNDWRVFEVAYNQAFQLDTKQALPFIQLALSEQQGGMIDALSERFLKLNAHDALFVIYKGATEPAPYVRSSSVHSMETYTRLSSVIRLIDKFIEANPKLTTATLKRAIDVLEHILKTSNLRSISDKVLNLTLKLYEDSPQIRGLVLPIIAEGLVHKELPVRGMAQDIVMKMEDINTDIKREIFNVEDYLQPKVRVTPTKNYFSKSDEEMKILEQQLKIELDRDTRMKIYKQAFQSESKQALPFIQKAVVEKKDLWLQEHTMERFLKLNVDEALSVIEKTKNHSSPTVRMFVAKLTYKLFISYNMNSSDFIRVINIFDQQLNDKNPAVQLKVLKLIRQSMKNFPQYQRLFSLIEKNLYDNDKNVSKQTIEVASKFSKNVLYFLASEIKPESKSLEEANKIKEKSHNNLETCQKSFKDSK